VVKKVPGKLLILSEYANKIEKIRGTLTNTNSYREIEALSDIFTPAFFTPQFFLLRSYLLH